MKFCLEGNEFVRLVGLKSFNTKTGNKMHFATVTGLETLMSGEFVLDTTSCPIEKIIVQADYEMILDVNGKYSKIILIPLSK